MKIEDSDAYAMVRTAVQTALSRLYAGADVLSFVASANCVYILSYHPLENVLRNVAVWIPSDYRSSIHELIETFWDTFSLGVTVDFSGDHRFHLSNSSQLVLDSWMMSRGYSRETNDVWVLRDLEE